jgi:hypothetical protein
MSESPGPDVAVMDFTPAKDPPITAPIAASSSSVCRTEPPARGSHSARKCRISEDGVIGYPAKKRQPACSAPTATASLPESSSRAGAGA